MTSLASEAATALVLVTLLNIPLCLPEQAEAITVKNNQIQTNNSSRHGRFLNLFSVIRFSNTPCSTRLGINGTCYTEKQCSEREGIAQGTCAGGFGVCCTFSTKCGGTTLENSTYLTTDLTSSVCRYKVCKCNPLISQIRLDFTTFELAPPFTCGSSSTSVTCTTTDGPLIGDCIYDTFTVTTPGSTAPPVICGYNTNQHMYIPSAELCNNIVIKMDMYTRVWDIKVTQFEAGQHIDMVAPPGCLQWNTGTLGTVQNFNFKDRNSFHLSSQRYSICWRRERSYCALCLAIGYFGLSNVPSQVPATSTTNPWSTRAGMTDSICCSVDTPYSNCASSGANDYIEIEGAREPPIMGFGVDRVGDGNRFCGRWLGIAGPSISIPRYTYNAVNAAKTLCTQVVPFKMNVMFSDGEKLSTSSTSLCGTSRPTAIKADTSDECATFRTYGNRKGTLGFQLDWWHRACT